MVVDGGAKVVDREVRREGVREAEALELAVGERDRRLEPLGDLKNITDNQASDERPENVFELEALDDDLSADEPGRCGEHSNAEYRRNSFPERDAKATQCT